MEQLSHPDLCELGGGVGGGGGGTRRITADPGKIFFFFFLMWCVAAVISPEVIVLLRFSSSSLFKLQELSAAAAHFSESMISHFYPRHFIIEDAQICSSRSYFSRIHIVIADEEGRKASGKHH